MSSDLGPPVSYALVDTVALIRLSRPRNRNALSSDLLIDLGASFMRAVSEGANAAILTGSGDMFCAGGDLASAGEAIAGDLNRDLGRIVDDLHALIRTIRTLPMPVVAAVNGPAIGAGMALAMAADVRVMSSSAYFLPAYVGVGASPDGGASYHLARAFGESQALSHFLLNRRFTADELARHGLVAEVVDAPSAVFDAALVIAQQLSQLSFAAVESVRELVAQASAQSLDEHLDIERRHFLSNAATPGFAAGIAPFARSNGVVHA